VNLTPLRQRNFSLLWWAGMISITGDWALRIALPIYVLRLTGSPAWVSAVVIASLLASPTIGAVAGAYVDRWDRRRVVVVVNLLQAAALLPLLLVDSASRVWIVVVVAFIESALGEFFAPAENALLPKLVPNDQLPAANALNSLNNNIGRLIGPAVGGVAAAALGLSGAALLDAGTFVAAALLCTLIAGQYRADRSGEPDQHLLRELGEGLRTAARNRILRAILIMLAITSTGEGMMGTLFAVYVTRAMHAGGQAMGAMMSAQAVGGILGSLAATRFATRFRPVPLIAVCFSLFGLVDLAIFNYPRWDTTLWPVLAMFVLVGLPAGIGLGALITLFQVQTPDRLRGRVFALIGVSGALAAMLGAAIAGQLGDTVSVVNLLTAQGAGYTIAGILLRLVAGRGPDTLAEPVEPAAAAGLGSQPGATPETVAAT
jgi:predicted MFS family arabinose efflux permease